jgi:hypothetical protein
MFYGQVYGTAVVAARDVHIKEKQSAREQPDHNRLWLQPCFSEATFT